LGVEIEHGKGNTVIDFRITSFSVARRRVESFQAAGVGARVKASHRLDVRANSKRLVYIFNE
jgi:hypothetical protein